MRGSACHFCNIPNVLTLQPRQTSGQDAKAAACTKDDNASHKNLAGNELQSIKRKGTMSHWGDAGVPEALI
ncbi:hypothetical protein IV203_036479 [Nitzschia inconspicua]|uniref:Uncharacterized protein n=1 Tax=Nitzschia inconspicua TaxID=303405 RepID=A0A9K3PY19_9STRA|nr:hypothetical protein IV203_036479 [Nitzschia inconspicua]